jgi:hypothetical protein
MVLIQLIAIVIFGGIWSAVLAPLLQFAFKLVEGQRNEFRDAYRICFSATFIHLVVQSVLPFFLGESWIFNPLGIILGICVFTYLIARELGDLKRSILIALALEGATFLFVIALMAIIVSLAAVTS